MVTWQTSSLAFINLTENDAGESDAYESLSNRTQNKIKQN